MPFKWDDVKNIIELDYRVQSLIFTISDCWVHQENNIAEVDMEKLQAALSYEQNVR